MSFAIYVTANTMNRCIMKTKCLLIKVMIVCFLILVGSGLAYALPSLQLDILGGTYDTATETIVSTNSSFTLYALLDPGKSTIDDTYFISAALRPVTVPPGGSYGSFTFDGTPVNVTSGMVYGIPPLASADLPTHSIFETYFQEFSFNFNSSSKTLAYNSQDYPGQGPVQNLSGTMYYKSFSVNTATLAAGYGIHFDLYNEKIKKGDLSLDLFAPFSHDAEYRQVPEPTTILLLGLGMIGVAGMSRKLKK
jgi:hypothetical protein